MIEIWYAQEFVRKYAKPDPRLKEEVKRGVALFKNRGNHHVLKVHKLKGGKKDCWSFSVNFRFRVIFQYADASKRVAQMLDVGDHDVYE